MTKLRGLFRRAVALVVAVVSLVVWTGPVMAADLSSALSSLGASVQTNSGGRYQAAGRNIFVTGGFSAKFSTRNSAPALVSITPPSWSAGCGGISAHFGGFSFISGQQIEQWVRVISQGAIGFVVNLAIKALCPVCEAVLALMQRLAQQASKMAMDACRAGEQLAAMATSWVPSGEKQSVCGSAVTASGWQADFLATMDEACTSVGKSVENITKLFDDKAASGVSDQALTDAATEAGIGNQSWIAVSKALRLSQTTDAAGNPDRSLALILLNMVGTNVTWAKDGASVACAGTSGAAGPSSDGASPGCYYPPRLEPKTLMHAYMCGDLNALQGTVFAQANHPGQAAIRRVCALDSASLAAGGQAGATEISAAGPETKVWDCKDGSYGADHKSCLEMVERPLKEVVGSGAGLFPQVWSVLHEGVLAVSAGQPVPASVRGLLESTDLPVYQALNVAAVYPSVALGLVDSMAMLIAQSIAAEKMSAAASALSASAPMRGTDAGKLNMSNLLNAMNGMQVTAQAQIRETVTAVDLHMMLYAQINDVNRRIQQSVLSGEMLAVERVASQLKDPRADSALAESNGGTP